MGFLCEVDSGGVTPTIRPDWATDLLVKFEDKKNIRDRHFDEDGNLFLQFGKMGGAFSGDLVHPTPTTYAVIADGLLGAFNKQIRLEAGDGRTFGGFSQPIPQLDSMDRADGDMLDRVAEDDLLLEHMIKKDFGDPAHLQYGQKKIR